MNSTEETKTPHISVNAQYTKDLSFENPGAPASLVNTGNPPHIDLALDLNIQRMPEDEYFEVEIIISAKVEHWCAISQRDTRCLRSFYYSFSF